jgi:HTH-type transcriptional regulator, competence development regulator
MDKHPSTESGGSGQSLGDYLRNIRKLRQHSLRQVEEEAAVSNAYLSQLENDKIEKPSPHILHKLAMFYKVPYETLMQKAGYITQSSPKSPKATARGQVPPSSNSALGPLSREEEEKVMEFLAFIRSQKSNK